MARPLKCRHITSHPDVTYFKPQGIPMYELEEVRLEADEIEAIRLADLEGLYQIHAAVRMGVSRQTFGNILARAHKKVATALLGGKALRIATADESTGRHPAPTQSQTDKDTP